MPRHDAHRHPTFQQAASQVPSNKAARPRHQDRHHAYGLRRSAMPQIPVVRDIFREGGETLDFGGVMGDGRAVGHDCRHGADAFEAVVDAGWDLDARVILLAEKDLLDLPFRRRGRTGVVEHQLDRAGDDGIVQRHLRMEVPGLDRTGIHH